MNKLTFLSCIALLTFSNTQSVSGFDTDEDENRGYNLWRLVQAGRPGGVSPHGDHYGDMLKPSVDSETTNENNSRLPNSRGTSFYIKSTSNRK